MTLTYPSLLSVKSPFTVIIIKGNQELRIIVYTSSLWGYHLDNLRSGFFFAAKTVLENSAIYRANPPRSKADIR